MSGRLAEMTSAGIAPGLSRLSPIRPSSAPTRVCVRLSTYCSSPPGGGEGNRQRRWRGEWRCVSYPSTSFAGSPPQPSWGGTCRSKLARLLFDHPGLALADQFLEVGLLAGCGGVVLLDDRAFEGRRGVLVNDTERDRADLRHI